MRKKKEIADMEAALLEYQKYKNIAKTFEEILSRGKRSFPRNVKPDKMVIFAPPKELDNQKLWVIFTEVLKRIPSGLDETFLEPKKFTLEEKKTAIKSRARKGKTSFKSLFNKITSKVEVIVTFLAVLEMIKQKEIVVIQSKNFSDFNISLVE